MFRFKFKLFGYKFVFNLFKVHVRKGVRNTCGNGYVVNFIDFDNNLASDNGSCLELIKQSLIRNQYRYFLGDYFIVQSYPYHSYHTFCLDKIHISLDKHILRNTMYIDNKYSIMYDDYKVLRFIEKDNRHGEELRLIGVVRSRFNMYRIKSRMHNVFFNLRYGVPLYPDFMLDSSDISNLVIDTYESMR